MFRYRLRTLLILLAVLPPLIAIWHHRRSEDGLRRQLSDAKCERDAALRSWRVAYDAVQSGKAPESQMEAEQVRYYKGREGVEAALKQLLKRYGGQEEMVKAYQARRKAK